MLGLVETLAGKHDGWIVRNWMDSLSKSRLLRFVERAVVILGVFSTGSQYENEMESAE